MGLKKPSFILPVLVTSIATAVIISVFYPNKLAYVTEKVKKTFSNLIEQKKQDSTNSDQCTNCTCSSGTCSSSNLNQRSLNTSNKFNAEQDNELSQLYSFHTNNKLKYAKDVICHVISFGCPHNFSDGELISGILVKAGFTLTTNYEDANVVIINSCTVKNPSEDKAVTLANNSRDKGKYVIVTGCVPQAGERNQQLKSFSKVGVHQYRNIVNAVVHTINGEVYENLSVKEDDDLMALPRIRRNDLIETIVISSGCLGYCTYCKTKAARGDLKSFPVDYLVTRVENAILDGCQQIYLTSEDSGAWGIDLHQNITDLLFAIDMKVVELESKTDKFVMIRFGMTNPPYILDHVETISEILKRPHWFEFIHIPVQSGSNHVLEVMNREYTREDFLKCWELLTRKIPQITVATDIICGFCDETDNDHHETISLIEKCKFPVINISQFYARSGTVAASMSMPSSKVRKQRSAEVTKVFNSYITNDFYLNQVVMTWIEGRSNKCQRLSGRTKQYTTVLIDDKLDDSYIGRNLMCKITSVSKWNIVGTIADQDKDDTNAES